MTLVQFAGNNVKQGGIVVVLQSDEVSNLDSDHAQMNNRKTSKVHVERKSSASTCRSVRGRKSRFSSTSALSDSTISTTTGTPDQCQSEVDRLRRFLLFALCIDYSLTPSCPYSLSKEDFHHYTTLARRCYALYIRRYPFSRSPLLNLNEWIEEHDIYITTNVRKPARELEIPSGIVVAMLRTFISSICWWKDGYLSVFQENMHKRIDAEWLARKVVIDRDILFPKLLRGDSKDIQHLRRILVLRNEIVGSGLNTPNQVGGISRDGAATGFSVGGVVERICLAREMEFAGRVAESMGKAENGGSDAKSTVLTVKFMGRTKGREDDLLGRRKVGTSRVVAKCVGTKV